MGREGRFPFQGYFRVAIEGSHAGVCIAGALGGQDTLKAAHQRARVVEVLLSTVADREHRGLDRHGLLRRVWTLLSERADDALRAELTAVLVAVDEDGTGVAGVGLGGVWAVQDGALRRLVPRSHPLLGGPGLPDEVPGVLTLERRPVQVVASAWGQDPLLPPVADVQDRCGGRR